MTDLTPAPGGYPIKLVRDGTAAMINSTGEPGELFYEPLDHHGEIGWWLKHKLNEEVGEFLMLGPDRIANVRELLDVYAVVVALAQHWKVDLAEGLAEHPRGGFTDHIMMRGRHPEFDG